MHNAEEVDSLDVPAADPDTRAFIPMTITLNVFPLRRQAVCNERFSPLGYCI